MVTGECEIRRLITAPVRPGDDVFDMESCERGGVLVDLAILTKVTGPSANEGASRGIDHGGSPSARNRRAWAWSREMKAMVRT